MRRWEQTLERDLPRPIVLAGSLHEPGLGLGDRDREWLADHCHSVLHSAASLKFQTSDDGEPSRTNLLGTKRLLDFFEPTGLDEFHHVSTAYVAGAREGRVREDELDMGQSWGNPYEETKVAAEKMLAERLPKENRTIYRPSIIVGDSQTGYSATFHGFYTPLRLGVAVCPKLPTSELAAIDFLGLLGLRGDECKNLVPVDWVSAAIVRIMGRPDLHGATYHLTHPRPLPVSRLQEAFVDLLLPLMGRDTRAAGAASSNGAGSAAACDDESFGSREMSSLTSPAAFTEQMEVYRAYWRHDPTFDRANILRALPELPCPELDAKLLRTLGEFAMRHNFSAPLDPPAAKQTSLGPKPVQDCSAGSKPQVRSTGSDRAVRAINLQISGPGGGEWHVVETAGRLSAARPGGLDDADFCLRMNHVTWRELSRGRERSEGPSLAQNAVATGKIVMFGPRIHRGLAREVLETAAALAGRSPSP